MADPSYGEGDTHLVTDVLPQDLADHVFETLRDEVQWNPMYHRGGEVPRLVAVQTKINEDGSYPIYRHPSDTSPSSSAFSPLVREILSYVQLQVKHPLNHALIQYYRTGADYISEHSDKTIDIISGSKIVNASFGAERVMTLREKRRKKHEDIEFEAEPQQVVSKVNLGSPPRASQQIPLPHNSVLLMGLKTNNKWLHSIRQSRRPSHLKSPSELSHNGERISLTFRSIGTFLIRGINYVSGPSHMYIFGQGAKGKTKEEKREVVVGGEEAEKLLEAFGEENHSTEFDSAKWYGKGFDVLHFRHPIESLRYGSN